MRTPRFVRGVRGKRRLFEADGPIALRCFLLTNGSIASGVNSRARGIPVKIVKKKMRITHAGHAQKKAFGCCSGRTAEAARIAHPRRSAVRRMARLGRSRRMNGIRPVNAARQGMLKERASSGRTPSARKTWFVRPRRNSGHRPQGHRPPGAAFQLGPSNRLVCTASRR